MSAERIIVCICILGMVALFIGIVLPGRDE